MHFKDWVLNFQNLPKNQKSVENSLRKCKITFRFSSKNTFFLCFPGNSWKSGNYNRNSHYNLLIFPKFSENFGDFHFSQRIFNGFLIFLKILKIWSVVFKMRLMRVLFYNYNYAFFKTLFKGNGHGTNIIDSVTF